MEDADTKTSLFKDVVKHLPPDAQKRVLVYAECVEEEETSESLAEMYDVKDVTELVNHLAEFESGKTPYLAEDKLIQDYKLFWSVMGKVCGCERSHLDEVYDGFYAIQRKTEVNDANTRT
jgi:hypothetical protein